jgi:Ca2+-transporting ATPase
MPEESNLHAQWHQLSVEDVFTQLNSSPAGLSAAEVAKRLKEAGPNRVSSVRGTPAWLKLLRQFHQPLVYIMLIAVGVTASLGEWVDAAVIAGIVLANAIVGFLQETKAETAIDALAKMVVTETTVRREDNKQRVPSESLVAGDVVLLQSGDRVPADLRLIEVRSLHADESTLTGESLPAAKQRDVLPSDTDLADRTNLAFAGTFITSGQAEGVVCLIGDQTETGRIAGLIASAVELSTPLTKQIARFSQLVLWIILGLAALTFAVGVARGEKPAGMFMAAVALAVGAIPEGLPAAVTIVLAIGVSRMAKRQAIIRKLPAVETLGSTTIICTDKTGTLTENQMTVQEVFAGSRLFTITGSGYEPQGEIKLDTNVVKLEQQPLIKPKLATQQ